MAITRGSMQTGDATVCGYITLTSVYTDDNRIECAFGKKKEHISFGELLSKISKIEVSPNKLSELIQKSTTKVIQEWLSVENSDYPHVAIEFDDFDVNDVVVDADSIELDVTFYYRFDTEKYYDSDFDNDYDDWERYTNGFYEFSSDNLIGAYIEDAYNDYNFNTEISDIELSYDNSPTPPRDDYDDDDYVSVRYVPLDI